MAVIDPAAQWLFWLLLCPLAYTASWVPQWRLDWRRWYNAEVEWPFVAPSIWWGGAQTTLFYACSYAGAFLLWRLDQAALSEHDATMYTTALALYVAGSMLYSINQIPLFYWALPWQTLAIVAVAAAMFSSAAGLTCAIDVRGAGQYPAACVLQLAWCGWLWAVVAINTLVGALRLLTTTGQAPRQLHRRAWGSLQGVVRNEGANPPLIVKEAHRLKRNALGVKLV